MKLNEFLNHEIDTRGEWKMFSPPNAFQTDWKISANRFSGAAQLITGAELIRRIEEAKKRSREMLAAIADMEAKAEEIMGEES
jgi:hypothetical protein